MRIEFRIDLGNAAMQTPDDVKTAINAALAKHFRSPDRPITDGHRSGPIRDANGNTVGRWETFP